MKKRQPPYPGMVSLKHVVTNTPTAVSAAYSGAITTNIPNIQVGAASVDGEISDVWFALGDCGVDASHALYIEADVYINGTTCLSTRPRSYARAAGARVNTIASGQYIRIASISTSANKVVRGDQITCDVVLTRTASPTTEIQNFVVCVDIQPF